VNQRFFTCVLRCPAIQRTAKYADSARQNGALCDCRPQIREIASHSHVVVVLTLRRLVAACGSGRTTADSDPDTAASGCY
jgi:hypothetical protein